MAQGVSPETTPPVPSEPWRVLSRTVEVSSPWITLIGERLLDDSGTELEYWRIERSDSLIVLTIHRGRFIVPPRQWRPGVARLTLDLPGGRLAETKNFEAAAATILRREFALDADHLESFTRLNKSPWDVDSSVSSQRLYGAVAEIDARASVPTERIAASYPADLDGARELRSALACMQCRTVIDEWLHLNGG
jgi:hypothetical protein